MNQPNIYVKLGSKLKKKKNLLELTIPWPEHTGKGEGLRGDAWQPVDLHQWITLIVTESGTGPAAPPLA